MRWFFRLNVNKEDLSVTDESHKRLPVSLKPTQTTQPLNLVHVGLLIVLYRDNKSDAVLHTKQLSAQAVFLCVRQMSLQLEGFIFSWVFLKWIMWKGLTCLSKHWILQNKVFWLYSVLSITYIYRNVKCKDGRRLTIKSRFLEQQKKKQNKLFQLGRLACDRAGRICSQCPQASALRCERGQRNRDSPLKISLIKDIKSPTSLVSYFASPSSH